jgi:hypothetical protein
MRHWLVVAVVMGLAAVDPGAVGAEENSSQRARFDELFDRIWDWQLSSFPEFATYVGVPGHNDRWTDVSLEAIAQRRLGPTFDRSTTRCCFAEQCRWTSSNSV